MKMNKKSWVGIVAIALVGITYAGLALASDPHQDCGVIWWWDPFGWFCRIA